MDYSIEELVNRCKNGDEMAKDDILRYLFPLIISSIKKYYFGVEEFEDLIQEGRMKILLGIRDFDRKRGVPFLGYIKLQLQFLYMERRKKVRNEISLNEKIYFLDLLVDEKADVEGMLLKGEEMDILRKGLKSLTKRQRQIIRMYYGLDMNMREIAKKLGLYYGTVVKTRKKSLEKLKGMNCSERN